MHFIFLSSGETEQGKKKKNVQTNPQSSLIITALPQHPVVSHVACNFQPSPSAASKPAEISDFIISLYFNYAWYSLSSFPTSGMLFFASQMFLTYYLPNTKPDNSLPSFLLRNAQPLLMVACQNIKTRT